MLSARILRSFLFFIICGSVSAADALADGFAAPTTEFRPETWFHLIGGNVSKPGLTADLEAIAGAGLQGIQLFHGRSKTSPWPGVDQQIECLSPNWDDMIHHVARECRRLGLRFSMQNCPGWSMAGGPWITPEFTMRHLAWSRTQISGGNLITTILPIPENAKKPEDDFRDIAVIAFPTPHDDSDHDLIPQKVHSNRTDVPWSTLFTSTAKTAVTLKTEGEAPWVEVTFAQPTTLRSIELPAIEPLKMRDYWASGVMIHVQAVTANGLIEVGQRELPRTNWQDRFNSITLAFPDATATTFRLSFVLPTPIALSYLRLSTAARINDHEGQAGFTLRSLDRTPVAVQDPRAWIASGSIIDLSDRVDATGRLQWNAPAGEWSVVRFGHVSTKLVNGPAPKEATGLECDKLSTAGAEKHFTNYIGRITAPGGPAADGLLNGMLTDSWECRTQTWTPKMEAAFRDYRGYELRRWLPALAGWVIDDQLTSERFLRDWRATIDDLLVDGFFAKTAQLAHARGVSIAFETAAGDTMVGDILRYFSLSDTPMCEFWQPDDPHRGGLNTKPVAPTVSAAHIYGKNRIAAESFTNIGLQWNEHPGMLKPFADDHLARGINHLVFHTYTHNPNLNLVPGTSFGSNIGTPFLRNQTWWQHMPTFTTYIARCAFMLQQGKPVSDVLWFLGDDVDNRPDSNVPFPTGYQFDYLNPDVLQHRLSVAKDGTLTTPEGLTWKVIWLRDCARLTPDTLERLRALIIAGATVIGAPPQACATLSGGAETNARFRALVDALWGTQPGVSDTRALGAGQLRWGGELLSHLTALNIIPDCQGAEQLTWCHRQNVDGELYFFANPSSAPWQGTVTLRATGTAELWDPLTGTHQEAGLAQSIPGVTRVTLDLPASGSVFVMIRPTPSHTSWTSLERDGQPLNHDAAVPPAQILNGGKELLAWEDGKYTVRREPNSKQTIIGSGTQTIALNGPWTLSFPPGWETPDHLALSALAPWSDQQLPAARDFSGTATYATTFSISALAAHQRVLIDLGHVDVIAKVILNDQVVATLWTTPFQADLTQFVTAGENRLAIQVTSTWRNRLLHDDKLPENQRLTWTMPEKWNQAESTRSGLSGPVHLHFGSVISIQQH